MKNILVPTDFSANATHALEYAIDIANVFDADIHLLHAFSVSAGAGHLLKVDDVIYQDRKTEMDGLIAKYTTKMKREGQLQGIVRKGTAVREIIFQMAKMESDMIIMGTQGATGFERFVLGSVASATIQKSTVPVLTVPSNSPDLHTKKLLLALDTTHLKSTFDLGPLIDLYEKYAIQIQLLHVLESKKEEEIDPSIRLQLAEANIPSTYAEIEATDVKEAILNYAKQEDIDILCMIHHPRGWFDKWFDPSMTYSIALDAALPLLVLYNL
ncbi:MAG: universal stress protein [Saprospiraceae bacterium]|nr:universal stress protein [Saprospiraceae bacterium]